NLANAQTSGGPDTYGYTWYDSNDPNGPVYNWIDIIPLPDAQEVKLLSDDNTRGPFAMNGSFHFYWYDVTTFYVGSNGYVAFDNAQLSSPFKIIPDTSLPQNFIAAMESDLNFDGAGNTAACWYWRNANNDTLIISWIGVPFWDPNPPSWVGSNTFQIILSNVDSSITMQYMEQSGVTNVGPGDWMSIGIENNSGAIGLQHSHNVYPPINYAIKYYYPSNSTFQVNDASTAFNDNETTGGLFISKSNTDTFHLNTGIKNVGNTILNPFNVQSDVKSFAGVTIVSNGLTTDTLQPGQTQNVQFTQGFIPVIAGTFRYRTTTNLSGDATPSNNSKTQELVVVDTTTANQWLSFDNGVNSVAAGISWQGGNGGVGMHFIPPYYPCRINSVRCYIVTDPTAVGYSTLIYDDDGLNGAPLTLLDSQFVAAPATGTWVTNILPTPLVVNSGGVYVAWYMGGAGIAMGLNTVAPISNRTYEILGQAWAIYRNREIEDVMININISKTTFPGIDENDASRYVSDVYPNPATDFVSVDYKLNETVKNVSYAIYDLQGKKVAEKIINQTLTDNGIINIDVHNLSNGLYIGKLKLNDHEFSRRINVVR
ncbi:MAG: T9SS type A sorting domain-containing protein, partial [Bacteroidia bacterium]